MVTRNNNVSEDNNPEQNQMVVRNPKVLESGDEDMEGQLQQLDSLGMSLSETRSEAIDARARSGIENEWTEDLEHYEGIDDVNRGELSAWRSKPAGQAGLQGDDDDETGSTVFFNITRPYCDTAAARVGDMLLPTDERGWAIDPTPIPDMVSISKGDIPPRIQGQLEEASNSPEHLQQMTDEVVAQEKAMMKEAKDLAKKAEKRIDDWHVQCQYNAEMRRVIEDATQVGTGIMKGPIPEMRKRISYVDGKLQLENVLEPVSRRVDVFNCFPDAGCGQNIHNGAYHWERDDITKKDVIKLKDDENYIAVQLNKVLTDGPYQAVKDFQEKEAGRSEHIGLIKRDTKHLFEIWYYYGMITQDDLQAAGVDVSEFEEHEVIHAHIVMINNRVIRASLNHLDSGEFPYDYMPWQQRSGLPWGIGVSRQIRTPQRVINGAGRNMMDNAGLAGGPMWIFNQGMVEPLDGIYELAPRKGWIVSEDAESEFDVSKAFTFIKMDMMQEELQAILTLGMQLAEHISGLPSLLQGQESQHAETMGGQQMRRNDGSTTLRRVARLFDDKMTTPHIRRYYDYLLTNGEDDEKGDNTIKARGSSALVERDLQNQSILDMASLVSDPTFGLDKKKWAKEYLRSQRLDPSNFEFDDDEWKEVLERLSAPAPDSAMQIAELKIEFEKLKLESNMQFDTGKVQNENQNKERDREIAMAFKSLDSELQREIAGANLAGTKDTGLDKIKAHLAEIVMTLNLQEKMSGDDGKAPQVANSPVEPEGRAPDDQAFQK